MTYKKFIPFFFVFILFCLAIGLFKQWLPGLVLAVPASPSKDTFSRYQKPNHFPSTSSQSKLSPQTLSLPEALSTRSDIDTSITKKVLVLEYNPIVKSSGLRLSVAYGWNDPGTLLTQYISDLKANSDNVIDYVVSERITIDDYTQKADGFKYTDASYSTCINSGGTLCHSPDLADYYKILADYQVCEKSNSGQIDEVWIFGAPYFGYWEANMAGPNSFYTNASPMKIGTSCTKNLNIMGFNYERGVAEMTENFIHRTEGTMVHMNTTWKTSLDSPPYTFWDKFTLFSAYPTSSDFPSYGVGNIHFPCNVSNLNVPYDWSNLNTVSSNADDWLNFPNLTGATTPVNCNAWGCTGYGFEAWWMNRVPHYLGTSSDGRLNNWWKYILDFDNSYIQTCNQVPQVSAVSPVNNYQYPSYRTNVSLAANAIFNTCNGTRERQIWVRDVTQNQGFYMLCYYSNDTADTNFSCGFNVVANHQYQWIATANNESYSVSAPAQNFTIGSVITPTPIPSPTPTPAPDTTPPSVSITSPLNNSTVSRNTKVTIKTTATDNVKVARVEVYVNSVKKCSLISAPYNCSWSVPSTRGIKYTLTAKAFDAANNNASNTIIVTSK